MQFHEVINAYLNSAPKKPLKSDSKDIFEKLICYCFFFLKDFTGDAAAVQVDLQGMSSLPCCRLSCKSPAFSSASLDFILSLLLQNNLT